MSSCKVTITAPEMSGGSVIEGVVMVLVDSEVDVEVIAEAGSVSNGILKGYFYDYPQALSVASLFTFSKTQALRFK